MLDMVIKGTVDGKYRFGFNGKEKDDELHGSTGTGYEFGARLYDPRLGRWLSIDPLAALYPEISPYAFCANSPIQYKEEDGKGFNGGFSITNQSTSPVVVVGTSQTIITNSQGQRQTPVESGLTQITLQPGQRLEAYYARVTNADGSVTEKYTSRVVQFATLQKGVLVPDGKETVVMADADSWDVDYIKVQPGQTFVDEGLFSDERYNIDPTDKDAKTPNPGTGVGTIKLQPGNLDYFLDKDDANEGSVTISGAPNKLIITPGGEWENEPDVEYGAGVAHP